MTASLKRRRGPLERAGARHERLLRGAITRIVGAPSDAPSWDTLGTRLGLLACPVQGKPRLSGAFRSG
jgi:hypothetical protein